MNTKQELNDIKKEIRANAEKWQEKAMEFQGITTNVVLTLSVAALGFGISLLFDSGCQRMTVMHIPYLVSFLFLVLACCCGIVCTRNKQYFYANRGGIFKEADRDPQSEKIGRMKGAIDERALRIRRNSKYQVWLFGLGIVALTIAVAVEYYFCHST